MAVGRISKKTIIALIATLLLPLSPRAISATSFTENAIIVFDGSGSMNHPAPGALTSKIDIARQAAREVLPDVTRYRPTGLVTYNRESGYASVHRCSDVRLRVPVVVNSAPHIVAELSDLHPGGATPLSHAVELAAEELERFGKPGIVVLITDGLENCGYDPCTLGMALQTQGSNIKVHVISLYLNMRTEKLRCLAHLTQGRFATADSLEALRDALRQAFGCTPISHLGRRMRQLAAR